MERRPLDSAIAPLGVTGQPVVIPTGATNAVRSGTEESQEETILFIQSIFFRANRMEMRPLDSAALRSG